MADGIRAKLRSSGEVVGEGVRDFGKFYGGALRTGFNAVTAYPRAVAGGLRSFASGVAEGAGISTPAPTTAQPTQDPSFIDGTKAPYGATLIDQPQTGYRIVRGLGNPILTNVNGAPDTSGGSFIDVPGGRLGMKRGREAQTVADYSSLRRAGEAVQGVGGGLAGTALRQEPQLPQVQTPKSMRDYLAGVNVRDGAGALMAMNLASKFSMADTAAANREENLIRRNEGIRRDNALLRIQERNADTYARNAEANILNARVSGLRAYSEATKPAKLGSFSLTPPKPDTNALPNKDGTYPMLDGAVKVGDTTYSLSAEDFAKSQELANQYVARYMQEYPDAPETPEEILNRFGQQALLDVLAQRAAPTDR